MKPRRPPCAVGRRHCLPRQRYADGPPPWRIATDSAYRVLPYQITPFLLTVFCPWLAFFHALEVAAQVFILENGKSPVSLHLSEALRASSCVNTVIETTRVSTAAKHLPSIETERPMFGNTGCVLTLRLPYRVGLLIFSDLTQSKKGKYCKNDDNQADQIDDVHFGSLRD